MSIENDIGAGIDAQIDAMTTAGGYNYDYDNVNELKPISKTYPAVKTKYRILGYDDVDQPAGAYSGNMEGVFDITIGSGVAFNLACSNVVQDFQRMFTAQEAAFQALGLSWAELLGREFIPTNVRARPGKITMNWEFKIRVNRANPAITM